MQDENFPWQSITSEQKKSTSWDEPLHQMASRHKNKRSQNFWKKSVLLALKKHYNNILASWIFKEIF